ESAADISAAEDPIAENHGVFAG
ncbi:hypothetical protein A2U01_0103017, partial [Trifolium medium]|nr:hypothetical protein [Trifolium medium]